MCPISTQSVLNENTQILSLRYSLVKLQMTHGDTGSIHGVISYCTTVVDLGHVKKQEIIQRNIIETVIVIVYYYL